MDVARNGARSVMLRALAMLALIVAHAGCNPIGDAGPQTAATAAPSTQLESAVSLHYTISIDASANESGSVVISGTTNLPDGGVVHVFASRALRYRGEADIRSTNVAGTDITLSMGSFATTLVLDESNVSVGVDETFPLEVVARDVTVCARFETGTDSDGIQRQPDREVVAAVGPQGEHLANSPQVMVFGSATDHPANWLEVQAAVQLEPTVLAEIEAQQGRPVEVGTLKGFCVD